MNKMKMSILAVALMAAGAAMATGPVTGVSGSATSGVSGATSSYSNVNGVNQATVHSSYAKAQNTTVVGGVVVAGPNGAHAGTVAASTGSTETGAIGYSLTNPGGYGGLGGASSGAVQYGFGDVTATATKATGDIKYDVEAKSSVAVGTFSGATVTNSGAALSGSSASAINASVVNVVAVGNAATHAEGVTVGADGVATYGVKLGSDETVTAGGALQLNDGTTIASFQAGSFNGVISNAFGTSVTPTVPEDDEDHGGSNCNNGIGNGPDCDNPGTPSSGGEDKKPKKPKND